MGKKAINIYGACVFAIDIKTKLFIFIMKHVRFAWIKKSEI